MTEETGNFVKLAVLGLMGQVTGKADLGEAEYLCEAMQQSLVSSGVKDGGVPFLLSGKLNRITNCMPLTQRQTVVGLGDVADVLTSISLPDDLFADGHDKIGVVAPGEYGSFGMFVFGLIPRANQS